MAFPRSVLVAPDSFKGTLAAAEVAAALGAGLRSTGLDAEECPVADGGEGTVDVLISALGGTIRARTVSGPLGDPVVARFGILAGGETAAVESAAAAGLSLVDPDRRDPERASSSGVGELVVAAIGAGAREVYVGVGGTATTDGGLGAVRAIRSAGGLQACRLVVLCDVATAFEDAARVFAPQKGADAAAVARLGERLAKLAGQYERDPTGVIRTGAGGGLAGGLWSELGAELVPGAARTLDLIQFDRRLRGAGSVVVGEGRLDAQTERGKAIAEISRRARSAGVRIDAIVGRAALDDAGRARLGLSSVREAATLEEIELAAADLGGELALAGKTTTRR